MKKSIWIANAVMMAVIVVVCTMHYGRSSHRAFYRVFNKLPNAISTFQHDNKRMPHSLEDLGDPDFLKFDQYELTYSYSNTAYVLSFRIPGRRVKTSLHCEIVEDAEQIAAPLPSEGAPSEGR